MHPSLRYTLHMRLKFPDGIFKDYAFSISIERHEGMKACSFQLRLAIFIACNLFRFGLTTVSLTAINSMMYYIGLFHIANVFAIFSYSIR